MRKANAAKLKVKLDQDSIPVPIDDSVASQDGLEKAKHSKQKHEIRLAYDIAASYVQLRVKDLLSLAAKLQQKSDNEDSNGRGDSPGEVAEGASQVYKSKSAAYTVSTITAVVAAGERGKHEAEKYLQSLQSSTFEWFICDNSSNYTRIFVIKVFPYFSLC